jgi:NDP-sugar pyrophosphorylase family protein
LLALMRRHGVRHIPLLDARQRVAGLVLLEELVPEDRLCLQAVIMAGGKGTRLRPLTDNVPKPMLPIGNRPLLEHTIERLREAGVSRIHIATHYRPEKITEHFGDGRRFGVDVRYVTEPAALGTAGALGLLEGTDEPLLVINGDILTNLNIKAMLSFHIEHGADLTIAARPYGVQVPYGVIQCDGWSVRAIEEKPAYQFFVNAGVYLIQPGSLCHVPSGRVFDMTNLIERLLVEGRNVVGFPVHEYWLDIGRPPDYERAQLDMIGGKLTT